jgi:transposase
MIPHGVEVYVSLDPVNLQLSFDRLAGLVEERMGRDPRSAALFCFFNRRRTRMKALFFDGSGLCIFYKRLDANRFRLPEPVEGHPEHLRVVELNERELHDLLDGLELERQRPMKKSKPMLH